MSSRPTRVTVELYSDAELELRVRTTRPSVVDTMGVTVDDEPTGIRTLAKCPALPALPRRTHGQRRLYALPRVA